jgi:hypothetical protein
VRTPIAEGSRFTSVDRRLVRTAAVRRRGVLDSRMCAASENAKGAKEG